MGENPSVCLVVINLDGKDYLNSCLQSIEQNTAYENYSVTVVDNGSEDGSPEMVRETFPSVKLIENNRNLGFSIANNLGIIKSEEHDYYMLLNNDIEVHSGWLSAIVKVAEENDDAGIVGPRLVYPDGTLQHAGITSSPLGTEKIGNEEDPNEYTETREVEFMNGAAFFIDSEVINNIGYLDEMFSPILYEETDYCERAKAAGYAIYVAGDATATHYHGKTREKKPSAFQYFTGRKNHIKYVLLNKSGLRLLEQLWPEIKHLGAAATGYKFNPLLPLLKGYHEVLKDLPAILKKRYNRTKHIPSYYHEGTKDYSRRYN